MQDRNTPGNINFTCLATARAWDHLNLPRNGWRERKTLICVSVCLGLLKFITKMVEADTAKAIMEHCTCTANWVGEQTRGVLIKHNIQCLSRFKVQPINNKLQKWKNHPLHSINASINASMILACSWDLQSLRCKGSSHLPFKAYVVHSVWFTLVLFPVNPPRAWCRISF